MEITTQVSLLERMRDGCDALAWEQFFSRYWRALYGYARGRGCAEDVADEVVQEAMVAVFENRLAFRYDPTLGRFRDWLRRIVTNKIALHYRRQAKLPKSAEEEDLDSHAGTMGNQEPPDAAWEMVFERALLLAMLETVRREVTPETYQAFELTALHDLSAKDCAKLTGLSPNAIYLARKRVLDRLRELGAPYQAEGRLCQEVKQAMQLCPSGTVERMITEHTRSTMHARGTSST